ncbi:MAG: AEC family transporter [Planctomycetota bacterium]
MHVLNTLAPVFVVISLGAVLRRSGFLSEAFLRGLNRLVYWVALPALLFGKIVTAPAIGPEAGESFAIALAGTLAAVVVGLAVAAALRVPGQSVGTFVQASFRGNLAYVGLPVVLHAFDGNPQAETLAVLTLAPLVPIYNVVAVVVLLASRHKPSRSAVRKMLLQIATNPLLLSCLAGLAVSAAGAGIPTAADRTLDVLAGLTLPAALLAVGGALVGARLRGRVLQSTSAAMVKLAIAPAVGLLTAYLLSAGREETFVGLILLACPTAVASHVLADQLGGDGDLSAATIALTTVLSIVPLTIIVAAL